jgi:hypothetical protein
VTFAIAPFSGITVKIRSVGIWRCRLTARHFFYTVGGRTFPLRLGEWIFGLIDRLGTFTYLEQQARHYTSVDSTRIFSRISDLSFSVRSRADGHSLTVSLTGLIHPVFSFPLFELSSAPGIDIADFYFPPSFRSYVPQALADRSIHFNFENIMRNAGLLWGFLRIFPAAEAPWSIDGISSDGTFYMWHSHRYCTTVVLKPPDRYQFLIPPFAPSVILVIPLSFFSHFKKTSYVRAPTEELEKIPHPSARFHISELAMVKQTIDIFFTEREILNSAGFGPFKFNKEKTGLIPMTPQLPNWIAVSVCLKADGILFDVINSESDAAKMVKEICGITVEKRERRIPIIHFIVQMLNPTVSIAQTVLSVLYRIWQSGYGQRIDWISTFESGAVEGHKIKFNFCTECGDFNTKLRADPSDPDDAIVEVIDPNGTQLGMIASLRGHFETWVLDMLSALDDVDSGDLDFV